MRVLIVGGGGREHALAWKLRQSPHLTRLFCAPGNAGIGEIADRVPIGVGEIEEIVAFARREAVDLTVVGPETPLAAGLVDRLREVGRRAFGPTAAATRIESDKAFARELMAAIGVPGPRFAAFQGVRGALAHLDRLEAEGVRSAVVKASGLAAGKGVIVADTMAAAREAVRRLMVEQVFGAAGDTVLIEERLFGEEASLLTLACGETAVPLLPAQDYKRALEEDRGPNTGGMGSYAPAGVITPERQEEALSRVFRPTLRALAAAGTPYSGCLYGGVMATGAGLRVIEFNARFGDPETQAVLPLLEADLLELLFATVEGRLGQVEIGWKPLKAVCVVMTSPGYPDSVAEGRPIEGLPEAQADPDVLIFHAGTALANGRLVTGGGRVLAVTGLGPTFTQATAAAYRAVGRIHFDGVQYRRDIARRVLESPV